jgi:hypothetical protein
MANVIVAMTRYLFISLSSPNTLADALAMPSLPSFSPEPGFAATALNTAALTKVKTKLSTAPTHFGRSTPTDNADYFSSDNGLPRMPKIDKPMQSEGFRVLPRLLSSAALLITAGMLLKLGTLGIAFIPGLYLDFAGFFELGKAFNESKQPFIPKPASGQFKDPLEALNRRGYVYPKVVYNQQLLQYAKDKLNPPKDSLLERSIEAKQELYGNLKTLIETHIDPSRPTHLKLTRKQLEAEMGVSVRSSESKGLLRYLYPQDMFVDAFLGGGKASLADVVTGVARQQERLTEQTPQLELGFRQLAVAMNQRFQATLVDVP